MRECRPKNPTLAQSAARRGIVLVCLACAALALPVRPSCGDGHKARAPIERGSAQRARLRHQAASAPPLTRRNPAADGFVYLPPARAGTASLAAGQPDGNGFEYLPPPGAASQPGGSSAISEEARRRVRQWIQQLDREEQEQRSARSGPIIDQSPTPSGPELIPPLERRGELGPIDKKEAFQIGQLDRKAATRGGANP